MIPELRPAESRVSKANGEARFPYTFYHRRHEERHDGTGKSRAGFTQPSPEASRIVDEVEVSDSGDEVPCRHASYCGIASSTFL